MHRTPEAVGYMIDIRKKDYKMCASYFNFFVMLLKKSKCLTI